ncbi:TIR domain-containing protein [Stenotrophomonas maltophilia]|uniref:TIR domain-containing protein n=1 Tax=Stenotrophomonas maltophilia TaxID=40324 RepID=UPI0005B6CB4A|nr:nucleotide-binding protein [Stenotrophomonas maltophilia]KIS38419.1 hypothetical protein WJ66_00421 [Stenotrophomonas maltophilia WJ66]MCF3460786.1 DNA-binding protein [Stenotrophomonas maltophilia]MCF3517753.1 DNA-binding protein [Stenotrophomonas maltophilia]
MEDIGTAMAQLAGIRKGVQGALDTKYTTFDDEIVRPYFTRTNRHLEAIRISHPSLFQDIPDVPTIPIAVDVYSGQRTGEFHSSQLEHIVRTIDEVFEIRANSRLTMPAAPTSPEPRRVFITHGRAQEWRQIQAFIEKDTGLRTMELAQEASSGNTIIEKLERAAGECDAAVIVMTGDDASAAGEARARENVMHEIGYFHGRYGRSRVILLHEDGVSVPTNLAGIVYVPFPKGMISAVEGTLARELRAIYGAS